MRINNWYISTHPAAEPVSLDEMKLHLRVTHTDEDALITAMTRAAREYCESVQNRAYIARTITGSLDRFPSTSEKIQFPCAPLISVSSVTYTDLNGATQTMSANDYAVDVNDEPGTLYLGYNKQWPYDVRSVYNAVTLTWSAGYVAPFTVNTTTDVLTLSGTPVDGMRVRLSVSGSNSAALPTGLSADTDYFVRDSNESTCKLAASAGGAAIDITAAGSGTFYIGKQLVPESVKVAMKLLVGHWYENRETVNIGNITTPLDFTVKALLGQDRIYNV
jgi:uncharacterized phiE125 gp8 family phage protein